MWNNFFKHIDINPANVHILDGNASDLQKECDEFERKIAEAGGIELFIGGKKLYSSEYVYKLTHIRGLDRHISSLAHQVAAFQVVSN